MMKWTMVMRDGSTRDYCTDCTNTSNAVLSMGSSGLRAAFSFRDCFASQAHWFSLPPNHSAILHGMAWLLSLCNILDQHL